MAEVVSIDEEMADPPAPAPGPPPPDDVPRQRFGVDDDVGELGHARLKPSRYDCFSHATICSRVQW